jgi:hypothetical protein
LPATEAPIEQCGTSSKNFGVNTFEITASVTGSPGKVLTFCGDEVTGLDVNNFARLSQG